MRDKLVDPHMYAIYMACSSSLSLLKLLHEQDITDQVKALLSHQLNILTFVMQNRHYGMENLADFIDDCQDVLAEVENIKNG